MSEVEIRAARARFNRAIVDGDLAAIGTVLARDCVMVTGTDSAVVAGRNAQLKVWKRDFADPSRLDYTRTPTSVEISQVAPVACELGMWIGKHPDASRPDVTGTYAAKWRRHGGSWELEAEIFVTLS